MLPSYARSYIRESIARANARDAVECCESLAVRCRREGLVRALLLVDCGVPMPHYLVRRAMRAMAIAGVPANFKMALVACTLEDYRGCKYAEVVAARCEMRAKAFFDETRAVSWLENEDDDYRARRRDQSVIPALPAQP
jgi:hypothetical protein